MRYLLLYSQPRMASDGRRVVIFEKKCYFIEATGPDEARSAAKRFLVEGTLTYGSKTYYRSMVSLCELTGGLPQQRKPELKLVVNNDVPRE